MLTFFTPKPKIKEEQIDALILKTLKYFTNKNEVINLITQRQWAFQHQIILTESTKEKDATLLCYALFANTLINCINSPQDIPELVKKYYSSNDYRYVGGENGRYSYTLFDEVNGFLLKSSLASLVLSFVVLPFSIPIGLVAIGITLSIVLPTAFYALVETLPNKINIKKEEDTLFKQISLSLNSDETSHIRSIAWETRTHPNTPAVV